MRAIVSIQNKLRRTAKNRRGLAQTLRAISESMSQGGSILKEMETGRVAWIRAEEAPEDWRDGRHLLGWHPDALFPGPLIVSWSDIFRRWITEDRVDIPVSHVAQVNPPD